MNKNLSTKINDLMQLVNLAEINFKICKEIYQGVLSETIKKWPIAIKIKPGQDFFLLMANNAFNEAISILHTLIFSTKKEEVRIEPLLQEIFERDGECAVNIPDDKVRQYIDRITFDYPKMDYLSYSFLSDGDSRLIGDIMSEIRKKIRLLDGWNRFNNLKDEFEKFGFHRIRHKIVAHKNKDLRSPAGHANLYLKEDLIESLGEITKQLKINSHIWFDYTIDNNFLYLIDSFSELTKLLEYDKFDFDY